MICVYFLGRDIRSLCFCHGVLGTLSGHDLLAWMEEVADGSGTLARRYLFTLPSHTTFKRASEADSVA